jgi:glyoxylase-like metal-dependent hydrolase (beta-lactamase superfamily II)
MGDDGAPKRYRKQEQEPASDQVLEVAPNVLRLQLPIAFTGLGHVNMYALTDERGVAIIDPGLPGPKSWRFVEQRLKAADIPIKRVHSVLVTHSHPDHYGGAGRLAKEAGAELITHAAFQTFFGGAHKCLNPDHGHDEAGDEECEGAEAFGAPWQRPTPWGTDFHRPNMGRRLSLQSLMRLRPLARKMMAPPAPSKRLRNGEAIRLAGRDLFALHTPGHTSDHLCLHDPEEGLLFSGDHILPTITPHISGIGQDPDPLKSFFASLDLCAEIEDVTQVLPAHGHPFDDLRGRVKSIKEHHDERMGQLRDASAELGWAGIVPLSQQIFRQQVWGSMAESETYAHLEHLVRIGDAEKRGEGATLEYLVGS